MALEADVLLLAAGLGQRLRPLTASIPKPLAQVAGRPLIDYNLALLTQSGVSDVIINLHYLGDQIKLYAGDGKRWGLNISYSEEPVLLDTGGALKQVEGRLKHDTVLIVNSDIIIGPDFSLRALLERHKAAKQVPAVTAVLRADPLASSYGEVGVDGEGRICSFLGRPYIEAKATESLMYTGIQAIDRKTLARMPSAGSVFSITRGTWVELLENKEFLYSFRYSGYWSDAGTIEKLESASKDVGRFSPVSKHARGLVSVVAGPLRQRRRSGYEARFARFCWSYFFEDGDLFDSWKGKKGWSPRGQDRKVLGKARTW